MKLLAVRLVALIVTTVYFCVGMVYGIATHDINGVFIGSLYITLIATTINGATLRMTA